MDPSKVAFPFPWVAAWALVAVTLAAWIALVPLEGIPHVQDEVVYTYQARLLAGWTLWERSPAPLAAYPYEFIMDLDGWRFGVFPNGWPAVLALGIAAGVPWLVNPLLLGLWVVLGSRLAWHVAGAEAGWFAAPLIAMSPGALVMAGSRMSHTACGLAVLAMLLALRSGSGLGRWLVAGLALAFLVLARPLDAVLVFVVLAAALMRRRQLRETLTVLVPLALAVACVAVQNRLLVGDWLVFPQNVYFDRSMPPSTDAVFRYVAGCNGFGFGEQFGCMETYGSFGHTPLKSLLNGILHVTVLQRLWLGWFAPLALILAALWVRRARGYVITVLFLWVLFSVGYGAYWYFGNAYG